MVQRIFDAMRHQQMLSFKNSAHMMRTLFVVTYGRVYTRCCTPLPKRDFCGHRGRLDQQGGVRHLKRNRLISGGTGVEVSD